MIIQLPKLDDVPTRELEWSNRNLRIDPWSCKNPDKHPMRYTTNNAFLDTSIISLEPKLNKEIIILNLVPRDPHDLLIMKHDLRSMGNNWYKRLGLKFSCKDLVGSRSNNRIYNRSLILDDVINRLRCASPRRLCNSRDTIERPKCSINLSRSIKKSRWIVSHLHQAN